MSNNVCALSKGAACEAGKLIVQVVGKDHPSTQKLVICDEKNAPLISLPQQDKPEIQTSDSFSSVLHVWDWENQPKRNLWLEVESERGTPIRVPLLDDVRPTTRQAPGEAQWNQIVPVVPLTLMRGILDDKAPGVPVLVRPGYIYVFYRGRLWRELEIRQADGKTTFHDIDLQDYRQARGFRTGNRVARGKALQDIWLPARWNNRTVRDVELAYAEIQLPAPRLALLEQDAGLRAQRCQAFEMQALPRQFRETAAGPDGRAMLQALLSAMVLNNQAAMTPAVNAEARRRNLEGRPFPLVLAAAQRPREPLYELQFEHPGHYLHDLAGNYPSTCQRQARALLDAYERGEGGNPRGAPELDPLTLCLRRRLAELRGTAVDTRQAEDEQAWQTQPAASDVLEEARQRQVAGILIEDPLYRLRQLRDRIDAAQQVVTLAAERASMQHHHGSALLVSNFILPLRVDGQPNPLSRFSKVLEQEGHQRIRHALAEPLNRHAGLCYGKAQRSLGDCFESARYQHALGDLFCLDGFDYLGAFALTGQCLAAMLKPASDPHRLSFRRGSDRLQQLMLTIADSPSQPLHAMLWPPATEQAVMAPYRKPSGPEENHGDGHFRPQAFAALENASLAGTDTLQVLEARTLLAAAEQGAFNTLLGLKSTVNAIMSVLGTLQGALKTAEDAVAAAQLAQARLQRRQNQTTRRRQEIGQAQGELRPKARLADISAYQVQGMEQARAMLPGTLGNLHFDRTGRVNERDLLVVRPEVLDFDIQQRATRMTGTLHDGDRGPLATTNIERARAAGMVLEKQEMLLVVLPNRDALAQRLLKLERQLNQLYQAEIDLARRQGLYDQARSNPHVVNHSALRQKVYRSLNTPILPAFLLMVEGWNVKAELQAYERNLRTRGEFRTGFGEASAVIDAAIALELLAERSAHNTKAVQMVMNGLKRELFRLPVSQGSIFVSQVTGRILLGATAAGLFAGLSLADALHEFALGDEAGWGYMLMAAGGLSAFAGAFMAGPAAGASLLALGPAGWAVAIGLALTLAGLGLVWWLDDTPVEEWLKLGPFGKDQPGILPFMSSKRPDHLQDEREAFYRLVGLFAGIRIEIAANPYQQQALQGYPAPGEEAWFRAMRRANIRISLRSNLPGLIGALGQSQLKLSTRLRLHTNHSSRDGSHERSQIVRGQAYDLDTSTNQAGTKPPCLAREVLTPEGLELYMEQPAKPASQHQGGIGLHYRYSWAVRAQLIADGGTRQWHFPAPAPTDPLRYDRTRHASPVFDSTGQAFWADEQTYKADTRNDQ